MLILTRREGEKLMIGDDICIVILNVRTNHIRIGIDAPKKLGVYRSEIYKRIQAEKILKKKLHTKRSPKKDTLLV